MMYGELDVFEGHDDQFAHDGSVEWHLESSEAWEMAKYYEAMARSIGEINDEC